MSDGERVASSSDFGVPEIPGYRLEEEIGRGGMGAVYKATQLRLDRVVALKVIKRDLAADLQFQARFVREARSAAAIDHPNVVPVYEAGEANGVLYLAMRYVAGMSLATLIAQEGALPARRAAHIIAQVSAALDVAHARGLVHRDVKPGNILLDESAHPYLTDFGLAKFGLAEERNLTQAGEAVGSMDYMAPEQIRGEAVDARCDVYGLGCVLYEALTGRAPFAEAQGMRILWAHLQDTPTPPSVLVPQLDPAFDDVVARAMAKDPNARYQSAGDLGRAALLVAEDLTSHDVVAPSAAHDAPAATGAGYATVAPPPDRPSAARPSPDSSRDQTIVLDGSVEAEPPRAPEADRVSESFEALVPSRQEPVRFRLNPRFRYVHHPLERGSELIPLLGNAEVVNMLIERIRYSSGGSFLVTGFRGVGKTTVIANALAQLAESNDGSAPPVLPVYINVARPRSTEELLFEVIRRLFEALVDAKVLPTLAPEVQRNLILAYTRTSLSFKETRGRSDERARSVGWSGAGAILEGLAPKLDFSHKTMDSLATEASFLAYSDADVEHDFLRIVSLFRHVGDAMERPRRWWRRILRRPATADPPTRPWDGKVVVVIDELDKLTARDGGMECIETLLTGLKNLLTTRGVHFLFVAGLDLHDLSLRESHRGNSVYDSVFGWRLYVPCIWEATEHLLGAIMDAHVSKSSQLESLHDYLKFKARGLARLLLMELNSFVEWEDGQPYLTLREADLARIEFYAGLQRILDDFLAHVAERHPFSVAIDVDRWRLGAYYVTDRILKTIGTTFTVDELVSGEGRLSIDPLLVLSSRKVEELLEFLVRNEVVERVRGHAADETYFGDVPTAQVSVYRVAEDVGHKLASFARINEHERAELLGDEVSPGFAGQPWADSDIGILVAGRYELRDELDRGGMGRVYRAYDRLLARDVAVKMLDVPELLADELMRERFTRKANLALGLEHPNIVATFDVFTDEQQRPGIAMQFVDGISLAQVLKQSRLNVTDAVRIADALLDALAYLEKRGIARLDLKPSRILVDAALHPIIIDVGLAKHQDADVDRGEAFTQAGVLVGTPAYLAPEQIAGGHIDIRTDMYTLALIVCELITGRPVRSDEGIYEILHAATEQVDLSGLPASPELREVLQKALSLDPAARYESAAEMRAVLAGVPEASYGFGLQPVAASPPRDQPMAAAGSGVP